MKYLVAQQLDEQLDNDAAFMTKWIDGKFTASQRRVLITKWVGNAWDDFCHGGYIHKYFEKTGCLIGTVGANLAKIRLQGLPDYSFNSSSVTFTINLVDSTDSESEASDGDDGSDAFSDEEYDSSDEDIADISLTDEQSSNSHPCVFVPKVIWLKSWMMMDEHCVRKPYPHRERRYTDNLFLEIML